MTPWLELRLFWLAIGLVLLIPLLGGIAGGFGGLEALAALFGQDRHIVADPGLRNNLRAICWMFCTVVPLTIWSLSSMRERAAVVRIIIVFGFLAGFARLTGRLVDGFPGVVPTVIMAIELVYLPILLAWHTRLVRRS